MNVFIVQTLSKCIGKSYSKDDFHLKAYKYIKHFFFIGTLILKEILFQI